jgi:hypothetical protein
MQFVSKRWSSALFLTLSACLVPNLAFGLAEDMGATDAPESSDATPAPLLPNASTLAPSGDAAQVSADDSYGVAKHKRKPHAKRAKRPRKHRKHSA